MAWSTIPRKLKIHYFFKWVAEFIALNSLFSAKEDYYVETSI